MDQIKKVFSPGSSKDDEVLYGDAETRRTASAAKTHDSQPPQLYSTEATQGKESGGVLRQIMNPGGEKYDEYHGTTATTASPTQDPRQLSTTEEGQKDSTITQQILNPNREKYDEQRFGSTATTTDAPAGHAAPQVVSPDAQLQTEKGQKDHSILRQILNPHGDKYDAEGFGSTAHVVGQGSDTNGSSSGAGIGSSTTQGIPDRSATTGTDSHLGRDAAVAGGLGAAGGAGMYAATHDRDHSTATDDFGATKRDYVGPTTTTNTTTTTTSQPITERSHPLGGQTAGVAGVGAGAAGVTGSNLSSQLNSAPRDVQDATYTARQYNIPGDNCDGRPAEGYVHHTQGPHSTDTANRLDPHVPGEFPTESGQDRHLTGGAASAVPTTSIPARDASLTQARSGQTSDHHYATDAALAGGLVGAGGAYAATRDQSSSTVGSAGQETGSGSTPNVTGAGAGSSGLTNRGTANLPGTTGSTTTAQTQIQPGQEHHYGRDAALGAGAGTAGVAVYEATQGRGDTGPASNTIGPHDSNIANIVDPRVQPQPDKMKDSTTLGPHSSDLANKVDPRVKETSTQQATEDQHRGRDAALAGGAGALGGAGAYAATNDHDRPITEQLASAQGTQTQPAYHATTNASVATQPGTSLPDSRHRNKEAAHADHAGLVGTGVGAGAGAFASGDQSAAKKTGPAAGPVDNPAQHTGDPKIIAATHRDDNGHSSSHAKDDDKEKKPSLIHRILHPGEGKEKESHHDDKQHDHAGSSHQSHDEHNKLHKKALGEGKTTEEAAHHAGGHDDRVIEPHTGLPMNVEKYGDGHGGTDGARNIAGYHETDPAVRNASIGTGVGAGSKEGHAQPGQQGVAGPDWDAIKKANTPY
ncbi:hypothetical protein DOTSEDRAFT_69679 [Dothistroma septosporum NZE10]|uniref:Uncharacterized protein n=1 Tax=Dothistroma septosporum (strain NZE10 / CBS 128990) TaxID=675120 RepID=N1PZK1_DOTSN|nr:hypothetical protein DOTSEDRAFT_69679 [Dothistroma septosporum NZE10]